MPTPMNAPGEIRNLVRLVVAGALAATVAVAGCVVAPPGPSTGAQPAAASPAPAAPAASQAPSGASTADLDSLRAQLAEKDGLLARKDEEITGLQAELRGMAPGQIVQVGTTPSQATGSAPSGWDTPESVAAGMQLLWEDETTYTTAPAQWDVNTSDTVYFTSMGNGYAGYTSPTYKTAGVHVIDARTYQSLATYDFDLTTSVATTSPIYCAAMHTPHGLGVSPDGTQLYVPTGDGSSGPWAVKPGKGMILVVDARSGVLRQVISTGPTLGAHHIKAFTDKDGNDRIIVEIHGNGYALLDPNDENRVKGYWSNGTLKGAAYQADPSPDGNFLWMNVRSPLGHAYDAGANVMWDLATGKGTWIHAGKSPNGIGFSANGGFTYMLDSVGAAVIKVDNAKKEVVGEIPAGVPGPYNIQLNWDNTLAFITGKGESTHNLGGNVGVIDLKTFKGKNEIDTGGQTIDHIILSPVRANDELWVSSSGTHETIVISALSPHAVKARIPIPTSGDTHSGGFVLYTDKANYKGELQSDAGGTHGAMLTQMMAEASASAMR